ncbi:hypothetical protein CDL15_Pgr024744 [Punica granatum]|uniref:J domain-containing protein n=1 Tax=Punica granatum TaxID=22663 RepID=A0A218W563_PUNGR|nr:hypothetical protein CDL15_Pgr024744 [Punica granatum]
MRFDVDHYKILGLPSGENGANLSEKEISRACHAKAKKLHPDKRPDNPNANADFQRLSREREQAHRAAFAPDSSTMAARQEERFVRDLEEEIARMHEMCANKMAAPPAPKGTNCKLRGGEYGCCYGNLSNPLAVVPLRPIVPTDLPSFQKPVEDDHLDNLVGAGYQAFKDSVLQKLQKAAENIRELATS